MPDNGPFLPASDPELWKRKVLEARSMSFEQKFRLGPLLFEQECKKLKNHLRSEHRDADEETINQMASDILEDIRRREDEKLIACGLLDDTSTTEVAPEGQ